MIEVYLILWSNVWTWHDKLESFFEKNHSKLVLTPYYIMEAKDLYDKDGSKGSLFHS